MEKRFGTDGIRGIYGDTLTEMTAYSLGRAMGRRGKVLIGRDNRLSSPALARAVASGVRSVDGDYLSVGLTTTPALYYTLTRLDASVAVMVTASHNPPNHNGLKVFTQRGKQTEEERREIERELGEVDSPLSYLDDYREDPTPLTLYEDYVRDLFGDLSGLAVVLDIAGGAGYRFKGLLGTLGAKVISLNARESGEYINVDSGALHPQACAEETRKACADLGIALDGDGDRIIAADREGRLLDGDEILYLLARRMQRRATLARDRIVMTVMSNGGVVKSLRKEGISVRICAVGDSEVAAAMREEGLNLGGEQSGHIILSDYLPTGDGLLTGAALLKSIRDDGPLSLEPRPLRYPQTILNLPLADRRIAADPALLSYIREVEASLGDGRVLLRASGTEPLLRILVEHPNAQTAKETAERIAARCRGAGG